MLLGEPGRTVAAALLVREVDADDLALVRREVAMMRAPLVVVALLVVLAVLAVIVVVVGAQRSGQSQREGQGDREPYREPTSHHAGLLPLHLLIGRTPQRPNPLAPRQDTGKSLPLLC